MSLALAERQPQALSGPPVTPEQLDLVKRTIANGATPAELQLYLYDCARQGVHPLDKLLHFTKRGGKYTPVTSIDLMRIRAAETGEYAGSDDATFSTLNVRENEPPFSATVTVWRLVQGQRCPFVATARWAEYYPGDAAGTMWRKMPHTMLGKCAEALALRKGFPRQLAGLYAKEEMDQAERSGSSGFVVEAPVHSVSSQRPQDADSAAVGGKPSAPNGGDSGQPLGRPEILGPPGITLNPDAPVPPDNTPQIEHDLPSGAVLIRKVEGGTGKAKGFVHTHRVGESFAVYADQLVTLAAEVCQNREPVFLEFKTSAASGKQYVVGIKRAPLPEALKPFAKEPPPPAPTECAVCGLALKECLCDVPF